jgi:hypothetical protein
LGATLQCLANSPRSEKSYQLPHRQKQEERQTGPPSYRRRTIGIAYFPEKRKAWVQEQYGNHGRHCESDDDLYCRLHLALGNDDPPIRARAMITVVITRLHALRGKVGFWAQWMFHQLYVDLSPESSMGQGYRSPAAIRD